MTKVTIGLPTYNAAHFLKKKIDSILEQTYSDFELIISDNCSSDSTNIVCNEYLKKDSRIQYFKQKENIGSFRNYKFILDHAKGDYFMWTAADDVLLPTFVEKNVRALDSNENFVGSISQVEPFGMFVDRFNSNPNDNFFMRLYKKIRFSAMKIGIFHTSGSYDERARFFLKKSSAHSIFGLYRIEQLRRSMPVHTIGLWEYSLILNLLKYGEINVINEVLWKYSTGGTSTTGCFTNYMHKHTNFVESFLPYYSFSKWCIRKLGIKFFLKNLDYFIFLYFMNVYLIMAGLIKFVMPLI